MHPGDPRIRVLGCRDPWEGSWPEWHMSVFCKCTYVLVPKKTEHCCVSNSLLRSWSVAILIKTELGDHTESSSLFDSKEVCESRKHFWFHCPT